ncbi:MAG: hypothetical protein AAGH17_01135 [Pseudomonadota bacterium]
MTTGSSSCNHQPEPGDHSVSSLDLDKSDYACLTAARFAFLQFAAPNQQCWLTVMLASDTLFEGEHHAETFRRVCAVVHEMRLSRKDTMRFSNPRCQRCSAILTEHERHLIQMIQAVRRGEMSKARISAMLLCEGHSIDRLLKATDDLARILPAVEDRALIPSLQS